MTDNPTWLRRAQQNPRDHVTVLGMPADHDGAERPVIYYEMGLNLASRQGQYWWYRNAGVTFHRQPVVTVRLNKPAIFTQQVGALEIMTEVLDAAKAAGLTVRSRVIDKGDPLRTFQIAVPTPYNWGWLGGTIGIDSWRRSALHADGTLTGAPNPEFIDHAAARLVIPTYPWPGRWGIQGKGLEILALNAVKYYQQTPPTAQYGYDPVSKAWLYESAADDPDEWVGANDHERGHSHGLPHPVGDPYAHLSLMHAWWMFQGGGLANVGLLPQEITTTRASPFYK